MCVSCLALLVALCCVCFGLCCKSVLRCGVCGVVTCCVVLFCVVVPSRFVLCCDVLCCVVWWCDVRCCVCCVVL